MKNLLLLAVLFAAATLNIACGSGTPATAQQSKKTATVSAANSAAKSAPEAVKFRDFTAPDTNGKEVSLSDIAGQGEWVLLDFWAGWCAPCRAENPHLLTAYQKFKNRGFTIVGYSLDTKESQWQQAIKKDKLGSWTNMSDLGGWKSPAAVQYGVRSIPANFLINPKGEIVARNLFGSHLVDYLEEALGE